ncbi:MAG: hypothetical protein A3E57_01495 [Candidatus Muproteobacteria bacterium RIFCSPHIGHO2_12_FULL_60_33]|nr:MAG: hypothetical protein A2W42_04340 [Candidatus Muproteobacteria bacterium RIFCSPHIGHO2_01_60_12]OGI56368.1 MAG: hypothetical protein A3E57_01495 [Candidatus Muproteobacteria bacterium RIFCSPHIGHO2_12_FULL_60_33]OGI56780.1 MAG: hypothetical protein A3D32_08705 [Candidatus Muproteobacteria bacterium RIFCSPHIGHO2_02_FULL_60_13]
MRPSALSMMLAIGISGCTAPPLPEDHFYRLELGAPAAIQGQLRIDGALTVQRIRMGGMYGKRPLLYSTAHAPTELRQYHYHYWVDNPARLIQEQLSMYLRGANIARGVAMPVAGATADYQVDGTVHRFEQQLDASGARVIVEIELVLSKKADTAALFAKTYRMDVKTRDATALAAAQGLGQVLTQCFAQFVMDLRNTDFH